MNKPNNPHHGSSFNTFLREEGIYQEVEAAALKKVIAEALAQAMKRHHLSVSRLANRLGTSRAAVNRVLDQNNTSITLSTLTRTASALGCQVNLEIAPVDAEHRFQSMAAKGSPRRARAIPDKGDAALGTRR